MSALIIHRRNELLYYSSDREGGTTMSIPSDVMSDMEILNAEKYVQVIAAFAAKMNTSVPTILVLADDMCYFAQTSLEKIDATREELISNTPFSHVETTVVRSDTKMFIIATNADIYETAAHTLAEKGIKVPMVVPWSALIVQKIVLSGQIDKITVKRAFDASSDLKVSAFPLVVHEHSNSTPAVHDAHTSPKKIPIGWIIFVSMSVLYAVGMIWFFLRP